MPETLTIELPTDLAGRVKAAAAQDQLSEAEWVLQQILKGLPSNYAQEISKLQNFLDED